MNPIDVFGAGACAVVLLFCAAIGMMLEINEFVETLKMNLLPLRKDLRKSQPDALQVNSRWWENFYETQNFASCVGGLQQKTGQTLTTMSF